MAAWQAEAGVAAAPQAAAWAGNHPGLSEGRSGKRACRSSSKEWSLEFPAAVMAGAVVGAEEREVVVEAEADRG